MNFKTSRCRSVNPCRSIRVDINMTGIPDPLPIGSPVYSSRSGWIADGHGGRIRAGKGIILAVGTYFKSGPESPGWSYLVQWDGLTHPTTRVGHCLCPAGALESLAHCADSTQAQCWLCLKPADYVSPGDLCENHWQDWFNSRLESNDLGYLPINLKLRLTSDD